MKLVREKRSRKGTSDNDAQDPRAAGRTVGDTMVVTVVTSAGVTSAEAPSGDRPVIRTKVADRWLRRKVSTSTTSSVAVVARLATDTTNLVTQGIIAKVGRTMDHTGDVRTEEGAEVVDVAVAVAGGDVATPGRG